MAAQERSPDKDNGISSVAAYVKMARQLRKLGEISMALDACDKGIAKFPGNSNIYIVRGETLIAQYNRKGKPESLKAALASFEKALKLDPQNYLARLLSSQIYLKAGARERAKALITEILKTNPDDERACALMAVIREKEEKAARKKAAEAEKEKERVKVETREVRTGELDAEEPGEILVSGSLAAPEAPPSGAPAEAPREDAGKWTLDEKVVIGGGGDEAEDPHMLETLGEKLTMFSRLDGLNAIFLLDRDGLPMKVINRARLDENIVPSLVYNLYKASMNAVRRTGNGSFQRGTLVSPIGTVIVANAFYATIAVVVDNDANLASVEKRIQRYLEEVAG